MKGLIYKHDRVFGLDLLRAIAIFCVVHGHGKHYLYGTHFEWFANILLPRGIDIFFVLSGFLIGASILKMTGDGSMRQQLGKAKRFYAKTALRILPNYYTLLLINLSLVFAGVFIVDWSAMPFFRYATMTQNIATPFVDFYWESWSIPIQWWFYILFPVIAIFLHRFCKRWTLPIIVAAAFVGSAAYRLTLTVDLDNCFNYGIWITKTLAARTDSIYVGVLAAWTRQYYPIIWQKSKWAALIAAVVMFLIVKINGFECGSLYSIAIYPLLTPIAAGLSLPFFDQWRTDGETNRITKAITALSLLSFSMFMTNLLATELIDILTPAWSTTHGLWAYILFWVATLAGTAVLYSAVERPWMKIRQQYIDRNK